MRMTVPTVQMPLQGTFHGSHEAVVVFVFWLLAPAKIVSYGNEDAHR